MNPAVAAVLCGVGRPLVASISATPAPSTPGMASAANPATSPSNSNTPRAPATIPARPRSPTRKSSSSASRWAVDKSVCSGGSRPGWGAKSDMVHAILNDQCERVGAPQFSRRRFRDHSWLEHNHVAGTDIDLGDHLVGNLTLDAAHLGWVLPGIGFDGNRESLPWVARLQADRDGTAGPDPVDARGGTFDVRRVDVAPGHDDHVFHPAAHHHVAGLGEIAQIACVVPPLVILRRYETGDRRIAQRHRFATYLDDADTASG